MKRRIVIALFACFVAISTLAVAQQINTDGLTEEQKAQLALQAAQMKKEKDAGVVEKLQDPKKLNEWVDLGKNVGLALTAVAKELGVASDEFLKSNTGKIAVVLIVWKVMGHEILDIVGGTLAWIVLTSIILWSFRYFHMTKRVKDKETKTVEYVARFTFESNDARTGSVVVHVIAFVAATIICMLIVFA